MNLTQTATTIDASTPASFTCSQCPFARLIEDNRYCCQVSQTASDIKRGHWTATVSCFEALAKAEAEKAAAEVEMAIAKTDAPAPATPKSASPSTPAPAILSAKKAAPATSPTLAKTAAAAIGTDNEPPNRGDNGRGRVQPIAAAKKLLPLIVPISRISSDISVSNFDRNELEILGELSLTLGGFVTPPVLVRDSSGYKVVSGHLQYHAAVLAKQLNPRAGETIPAIVLEEENQAAALNQLKRLKFVA
ncbi:hypothetical protein QUA03_21880 [Microcoleus sp. S36b_A4]|uniref:hypothetical protein n=1 Tax=Microcoleus sp. S36b_A4 TaxID=3055420 RepID=UPI002FD68043